MCVCEVSSLLKLSPIELNGRVQFFFQFISGKYDGASVVFLCCCFFYYLRNSFLIKKKKKVVHIHRSVRCLALLKFMYFYQQYCFITRIITKKTNRNNIIELCHSKNTNKYKHHIISIVLLFNNMLTPEASPNFEFRLGEIPTDILRQMGCFATYTKILQLISARWAITCCRLSRKCV